jgi:hypothetical protein
VRQFRLLKGANGARNAPNGVWNTLNGIGNSLALVKAGRVASAFAMTNGTSRVKSP